MSSRHRFLTLLALPLAGLAACLGGDSTGTTPSAFTNQPCSVTGTLSLSVAQATRVDCSNGGSTLTVAGGGASYLVVPEFATDQWTNSYVTYMMSSGTVAGGVSGPSFAPDRVPALPAAGALITAIGGHAPSPAQHAMDRRQRALGVTLAPAIARTWGPARQLVAATGPRALTVGSVRTFRVDATQITATTTTYATVGAKLQYVGANLLLYVDTLAPANGFTPTQLAAFGQYFDQTLDSIAVATFGTPSDVDGNGHVIVLMTPVVNAITPSASCASGGFVAGFFSPEDFVGASDPNSNQGEIFYSVVPDPSGVASCAHSATDLGSVLPGTFLHEFQHLINYAQHVVLHGAAPLASWLDEGLSIAGEEQGSVYYEHRCPPPACRTNAAQLFPDSSQPFVGDFLYDSYVYAYLPDTASITLHSDSDDGVSWRGGSWLLVRWLADHYGDAILGTLARGPAGGVSAIEAATGASFPALFADFGLALRTDSLSGLARTTAPLPNRFVSRNLPQLWARLYATSGGTGGVTLPNPVQLFPITTDTTHAVMVPGTATYFRLDTPAAAATVSIRFAAPGGVGFNPLLKPQLAIFRLPPGQ